MTLVEWNELGEMMTGLELLQIAYPQLSENQLCQYLGEMVPHRYSMVAILEDDRVIALTGYWQHTKIWKGRILEIDNMIVHPDFRSRGLGKKLLDYLEQKAKDNGCQAMVLDAFVKNHRAHQLYFREGYIIKGYHFLKDL